MSPRLPANEPARLEALRNFRVLDTPREEDFDEIVQLAAQVCDTPISLVSFVDQDRQWFKGRYGLDLAETPRTISFCAHAILNAPELMIVPDATVDQRFADTPLVTGNPFIRFYAGAPLVSRDGYALGTLCVIDHKPRDLSAAQCEALRILSHQVVTQLELRRHLALLHRSTAELTEANAELEAIACAISHDMQGPLRTMIGFSHLLQLEHAAALDLEGRMLVEHIDQSGHRMAHMLGDFLRLMRLRKRVLSKSHFDMQQLVEEVLQDLREQMMVGTADIELHPLPDAEGDEDLICQVWMNLISNALKFSREQAAPKIEIGGREESERSVYYVKDNGAGFDMRLATQLWMAFGRLHGSQFEGTGLGLAIAHRILGRHGGEIWAESAPGEGATFWFALPKATRMSQVQSPKPKVQSSGVST